MYAATEPRLFLVEEEDAPTYDVGTRPHMTIIEDDVIESIGSSLGASSLAIYVVLERMCDSSGTCHPSQETLGKATKLSERWVREAVSRLTESGFVEVRKRTNRFGSQASDEYTLPHHPRTYRAEVPPEVVGQSPSGGTSAKVIPITETPTTSRTLKRGTSAPETFDLSPAHYERAREYGVDESRVAFETEKFLDFHRGRGNVMKDWQAAWRTWMRNVVSFSRPAGMNGKASLPTAGDFARMAKELEEQGL